MTKLLVGYDGSGSAKRTLDQAARTITEAICETAERDGYTTIVVGRLNDHRLLGSVSSRVVQRAGCDFRIVT